MPQSPTEWLPEDHLAYFILDLVEDLDLGEIERPIQAKDARGERPYSPRMITALLLYGAVGLVSTRRIERATHQDVAFRMLAASERPHFTTINDLRRSSAATGGRRRPADHHAAEVSRRDAQAEGAAELYGPRQSLDGARWSLLAGLNGQIAVDEVNQIIVAAALSNQGPDPEYFEPMLRRVVETPANVRFAETIGKEPFIAVGSHRRDGLPDEESLPINARSLTAKQMQASLDTPEGHDAYARRKATVEPVFGQIRNCRGIGQMSFQGLFKN